MSENKKQDIIGSTNYIGRVVLLGIGAALVLISAYGFVFSVINLYLNHYLVTVGVISTGVMLTMSCIILISLIRYERRTSTSSKNEGVE